MTPDGGMTTGGGNMRECKTCGESMSSAKSGEWSCSCGRRDCVVQLNCVNVRAVPMSLRGGIAPIHRAFLEIIEEYGEDGKVPIPKMIEELNKRGFGGVSNG